MSDLRANTDLMRQGSNTLGTIQNEFHQINAEISASTNSVDPHLYDGQLAKKIGEIMAGTMTQAGKTEYYIGELSRNLLKKATEIEMVNSVSASSTLKTALDISNLVNSHQSQASAQLRNLGSEENNIFWAMSGFLGGLGYLFTGQSYDNVSSFFSNIFQRQLSPTGYFIITGAPIYDDPSAKKPTKSTLYPGQFVIKTNEKTLENGKTYYKIDVNGKSGWIEADRVTQATIRDTSKITGEQVPTGEDGKNFPETGGYSRYSYGDIAKSNCTYYAASAVYKNSDGRVEMSGFHGGGTWANSVESKIKEYETNKIPIDNRKYLGVDRVPSAGDVYCNDKSHVAFVEQTWTSNDGKKIFVVVSEENAGNDKLQYIGKPVGTLVNPIAESSGIARFRSVYVFENETKDASNPSIAKGNGRFIHINYNYQTSSW